MANEVNDANDKVERFDQSDRTSENTANDGVIGGDRHQNIHKKASTEGQSFTTFSDNNDDQSFKAIQPAATPFSIDFGDGTEVTSKGKVDKGQEALAAAKALKPSDSDSISLGGQNYEKNQLVAANITPNPAVVSDAASYPTPDVVEQTKEPVTKISQDLPVDPHTHFESGEVLRPAIEAAGKLGKDLVKSGIEAGKMTIENATHPFRGKIGSTMKEIPESAWNQAYDVFPQFKETGLSKQQAIEVMKAIVRNELYNYDSIDEQADKDIKAEKPNFLTQIKYKPEDRLTLGYAQLSITAVHERQKEYPKQVNFKGHEKEALMDPANTPLLVAATLVHNIEMYQRHNIPVTQKSLGYSYNPPSGRILPTQKDLDDSEHAKNVMHQLAIIRGEVIPKSDEL